MSWHLRTSSTSRAGRLSIGASLWVMSSSVFKELLLKLLKCVDYCHTTSITHWSLSPDTLLLDESEEILKIGDAVGHSFTLVSEDEQPRASNKSYEAPEILLGATDCSTPVDIWAVGCIFGFSLASQHLMDHRDKAHLRCSIFPSLSSQSCLLLQPGTKIPSQKALEGLKEKLFARNNSVKDLSKGVQCEMTAGIAGVARMFERLDLTSKNPGSPTKVSGRSGGVPQISLPRERLC